MSAVVVPVELGERSYDVHVGAGLLNDPAGLAARLAVGPHARRAALVTAAPVAAHWSAPLVAGLEAADLEVHTIEVPDGEVAKTAATIADLWARFAEVGLGRDDVIVALGGGVVGDMAGFAAATWHRGTDVIQVPTTLLAQCDAAIGGKTGVNLPAGKNLVGAFHQPRSVVCDTATLSTLAPRELIAGLGEVTKYAFIADPGLADLLSADPDAARTGDGALLAEVVARGVTVKADIVAGDEREGGRRMVLNYGHTFAHAIETLTGYGTFRHGEAVALGMVAAAECGEALRVSAPGLADATRALLQPLGLPVAGCPIDPDAAWEVMGRDKKARDGVRLILCAEMGDPRIVAATDRAAVDAAWAAIA